MAARLLEWNSFVVDPGVSNTQTPLTNDTVVVHRAVFSEPVPPEFVYAQRQCPQWFEKFNYNGQINPILIVVGRECKQLPDAPQVCEVKITYSNHWTNEQNADKPQVDFNFIVNPLERPALLEWGRYVHREAVEIDEDGQLVATVVGEPLVLEEERHRRMITVAKNVKTVTDIFAEGEDWMNEEDTKIGGHLFKKRTLWLWPIDIGHISIENGYLYFPISMTILHNPKTWDREIRNAGYHMRAYKPKYKRNGGDNGPWVKFYPGEPIRFSNGAKTDKPLLLWNTPNDPDRHGRPIQAVITGEAVDTDYPLPQDTPNNQRPKYKTYEIQSPEDFNRAFTKEELEGSKLKFRTRKLLNFTKQLPLT